MTHAYIPLSEFWPAVDAELEKLGQNGAMLGEIQPTSWLHLSVADSAAHIVAGRVRGWVVEGYEEDEYDG